MNSEFIRLCKLEYLAENDSIYQVWYRSYLDSRDSFSAFANSQPDEIRNMLYAYAEGGQNVHAKEGQSGLSAYAVSG